MKYLSISVEQTQKIARDFAKTLKGGDVVALYGELGAGKTTFIQAVAAALGIKRRIPSPTFVLARSYRIPKGVKPALQGKTLYHVDLYRLESTTDLGSIDLQEIMRDTQNITMIEWAEKAKSALPRSRIDIIMVYKGERKREITISKP